MLVGDGWTEGGSRVVGGSVYKVFAEVVRDDFVPCGLGRVVTDVVIACGARKRTPL